MRILFNLLMVACILILAGCEKFLAEKSNQKLVVPTRVADLQALMDDRTLLNEKEPNVGVAASDDFFMPANGWLALTDIARNLFVWAPSNVFAAGAGNNWVTLYNQIYSSNVVLDHIDGIQDVAASTEKDNVKGQALFVRARCYANLLQIWAMPYHATASKSDLGVPLRLDANFNVPSVRATVEEGYQQVLKDLRSAANLLPHEPLHPIRPAKAATFALLARTFLAMNRMDSCLYYTEKALAIKSNLIDYNGGTGLTPTANYPFARFNPEVIYDTYMPTPATLANGMILPALYNAYDSNDLRKTLYHRTSTTVGNFKGTYSGGVFIFNGIATDELYLMKAECLVRLGERERAIAVLNELLVKRFKTGTYVPLVANSDAQALALILIERRKELVFRGLRWMDVRRLNRLGANIVMKRLLDKEYTLLPNELRYALAIPEDVVETANIPQNLR